MEVSRSLIEKSATSGGSEGARRKGERCLSVVLLVMFAFGARADQSVSILWGPSPSTNVVGYAIYYGTVSGGYDSRLDAGTNTSLVVGGLSEGFTYFFAAIAYDSLGTESLPSNEVSFTAPGGVVVDELTKLSFTNSVTDLNLPLGTLTFSLSNAPAGLVINASTGVMTWRPSEAQGPSTNNITLLVSDLPLGGLPIVTAAKSLRVIVNEVNVAPSLPSLPDVTLAGIATLVVTNTATDTDIPANTLSYQLIGAPAGATIDANGIISWTPTTNQVPSTNLIQTVVTDYNPWAVNVQQLSATNSFTVTVLASNSPSSGPAAGIGVILTTLISFDGTNGAYPYAGLIQGADGNFYGTTISGGANDLGTVFKMTPGALLTTLAAFGQTNGATARAGLIEVSDGNFYGTTELGGLQDGGTAYRVSSNGTLTTLLSFDSLAYFPLAGLMQGTDGGLYGTTFLGGASYGTAFRLTTNGGFSTLISFSGANGAAPQASVVQGYDGTFYGTTASGGLFGYGTVFKLATNGTLSTLISFNNTNGSSPHSGLLQAKDGIFYGTTEAGGTNGNGTIFKLTTNGAFSTLASFDGTNGADAYAGLMQATDGNLYGTTSAGGANGYGTVFATTTSGLLSILISFNSTNGANAHGGLLQASDGNFYGTTTAGGMYNKGTIFRLSLVALPTVHISRQAGGLLALGWPAIIGRTYQAQCKTNFGQTNWINLGNSVAATNNSMSVLDSLGSGPQRFYRIMLVP